MKTYLKNLVFLSALVVAFNLMATGRVAAQTFTNLYSFVGDNGSFPHGRLFQSGNILYGTTYQGGSSNVGTLFAVNIDGTGYTNLHSFNGGDGAYPMGELISQSPWWEPATVLYGTTTGGGSFDSGTVFAINIDGTGFTNLHHFDVTNGWQPVAGLPLLDDRLYGTTIAGGENAVGVMFSIKMDGTGFTNLHSFGETSGLTNTDGAHPYGGLVLSEFGFDFGHIIYGTTSEGGILGGGTVFSFYDNDFETIYHFPAASFPDYTNDHGAFPKGKLVSTGLILYGTTSRGGASGYGTVFSMDIDGQNFTNLHSFNGVSDGGYPTELVFSGDTLYGTAVFDGTYPVPGVGTVFAIASNTASFSTLFTFTTNELNSGIWPGNVILSFTNNVLYGTTAAGGGFSAGSIFLLSPTPPPPPPQPPAVNVSSIGNQSILFWPVTGTNYILQSTTNLDSPEWETVTDAVSVNAFAITNTPSAGFFRLQSSE